MNHKQYVALLACSVLLLLSIGGGCLVEKTKPITIAGDECIADMEKLNLRGRRIGCLTFSSTGSVFAATYQNSEDGGPFFLCPSTDPSTCAQSLANHPEITTSQGELTMLAVFAPVSFTNQTAPNRFLPQCAGIFATQPTVKPKCLNTKSNADSDQNECWFAFHIKYTHSTSSMTCQRWSN